MPRLFIANFDFEHRLACGEGTLAGTLARINAALSPVWAAAADDGDLLWTPEPLDPAVFARLEAAGLPRLDAVANPRDVPGWYDLVFWGENAWAARKAREWKLRWSGCDAATVARVNGKRFALDLERRLGIDLPGSAICGTPSALVAAVEALNAGWVLKGEFGNAGREIRFGQGPLSAADAAWAGNRFRRKLAILVEPRLRPVDEVGLQFTLGRDGSVRFDGVSPLVTRPDGGYVGNRFDDDPTLAVVWERAIDLGLEAAQAVADAGYFGPLGIDAMRYRDTDGMLRLRAIQDVNARHTMGRLALGLRRFPQFAVTRDGLFRPSEFRAEPFSEDASAAQLGPRPPAVRRREGQPMPAAP